MESREFLGMFSDVRDCVADMVREMKEGGGKLVLFGAGDALPKFIELMEAEGVEILCLCDNDPRKWGQTVRGYQIRPWDESLCSKDDISVFVSTRYFEGIEKQLRESAFCGKVFHFPAKLYYKNCFYSRKYLEQTADRFAEAYGLLEDEASRQVYVNAIKYSLSFEDKYMRSIDPHQTDGYFGTELLSGVGEYSVIDCGAFDGDTLEEYQKHVGAERLKRYLAVEPDRENFEKLRACESDKVKCLNCGVGRRRGIVSFNAGMGVSCKINGEGSETIPIESIDDIAGSGKITFIKMDIEGAEGDAIRGAAETIKRDRPALAVSAYHKKEDMFELPLLIKAIYPGYRIFFRHTYYYDKIQPDIIIYALCP